MSSRDFVLLFLEALPSDHHAFKAACDRLMQTAQGRGALKSPQAQMSRPQMGSESRSVSPSNSPEPTSPSRVQRDPSPAHPQRDSNANSEAKNRLRGYSESVTKLMSTARPGTAPTVTRAARQKTTPSAHVHSEGTPNIPTLTLTQTLFQRHTKSPTSLPGQGSELQLGRRHGGRVDFIPAEGEAD